MISIALILTGGTICSFVHEKSGERQTNAAAAKTILEQQFHARHPQSDVQFTAVSPYDTLSENCTPQHMTSLLAAVQQCAAQPFDGILIAHGTDTLAFTAGILASAPLGLQMPVILVSSNAPLTDAAANGQDNFDAAVSLVKQGLPAGIWTAYRNQDGIMYLHHGAELRQCENFSESFFSQRMQPANAPLPLPCIDTMSPVPSISLSDKVLLVMPYNGLRYDRIPLDGIAAVIHGSYHSETANALEDSPYSVRTLLKRCQERQIFCGIAPCSRAHQTYVSGGDLVRAGLFPLGSIPTTFAYGAAQIAVGMGICGDAVGQYILSRAEMLYSDALR